MRSRFRTVGRRRRTTVRRGVRLVSDRKLFDAALAIADPAERAAYLDEACAGDAALRQHIEGLLAMHGQLGSFLEAPALGHADTLEIPAAPERPGTVIGP